MLDDIKVVKVLVVIVSSFLNGIRVEKFANAREVRDALNRDVNTL